MNARELALTKSGMALTELYSGKQAGASAFPRVSALCSAVACSASQGN
ncbi:MAG TPA: hypothetical protein VHC19_13525 [Pirellulales bacterium]|jgi:hypothetical protein|nr:hypothetical protein [Pirellulales bacterium]